jgi:hypothetical protein
VKKGGDVMPKLKYLPTSDLLFKMFLVKNPAILRELIVAALDVDEQRLGSIEIENPELLPENDPESKTCRLDLKVKLDEQMIDVEMQKADEGKVINWRCTSMN